MSMLVAPGEEQVTLDSIRRSLTFISSLVFAAYACRVNYSWLALNNSRSVVLLDFDVICGALREMALHRLLEHPADEPIRTEQLIGSNTINYLLGAREECTLPPGTAGELLQRQERLRHSLSDRASAFVKKLEVLSSPRGSKDPIAALFPGPRAESVSDLLFGELLTFANSLQEYELLDTLKSRVTPIETLLTDEPEPRNPTAFRSVYNYLQGSRPKRSLNNFNDALNVACAVKMFNRPVRSGGARRVPILISDTKLLASDAITSWLDVPRASDSPRLVHNLFYLIISESLLEVTQGRYRAVADRAALLLQDAMELQSRHVTLVAAIKDSGYTITDDPIPPDVLPWFEWSMLVHRRQEFERHWGYLFEAPVRSLAHDRVGFVNALKSPRLVDKLEADEGHDVRRGVTELIQRLRVQEDPRKDFWDLLIKYKAIDNDLTPQRISPAFQLTFAENDAAPLAEIAAGRPLDELSAHVFREPHDIRLAVHPVYVGTGAIMVVESQRVPSGEQHLSVLWTHQREATEIWGELLRLLRSMSVGSCVYQVFSRVDRRGGLLRSTSHEFISDFMNSDEGCEYFEISAGGMTVYADVEPLDSTEMQAGLVFTVGGTHPELPTLSSTISNTSAVPLSPQQYTTILAAACDALQLDWGARA